MPASDRAAQRTGALRQAGAARAAIKRELDTIADLDAAAAALRVAAVLDSGAAWARPVTLERLLEAIPSIGSTKARALAATVAADAALPCRAITPAKRHTLASAVRAFAEEAASRRPRPPRGPRDITPRAGASGIDAANRVRFIQIDALRVIAAAETQQAGAAAAAHLLRTRASEPDMRTLKLSRIVQAIDQVGPAACEALLAEFNLPLSTRLCDIEARTVGALAARLANAPTLSITAGATALPRPAADEDDAASAPPTRIVGRLLKVYPGPDGRPHAIAMERRGYATVITDYAYRGAREVVYLNPAAALADIADIAAAVAAEETKAQLEVLPAADHRWVRRDGRLQHVHTHGPHGPGCLIVQRRGPWHILIDYTARQAATVETYPALAAYDTQLRSLARDYVEAQRRARRVA